MINADFFNSNFGYIILWLYFYIMLHLKMILCVSVLWRSDCDIAGVLGFEINKLGFHENLLQVYFIGLGHHISSESVNTW